MMDKNKLKQHMMISREVIMLKVRDEILSYHKKINDLPKEEKKGEDLDEYSLKIILDLVKEYLDIYSIVDYKNSWELIQDVLRCYSNGKLPYGFMAKYDYDDIMNALDRGSEFFAQYQEKFNSEGKHGEIKLIQNQEVSIVDRESGNVEFSFDVNSGEIIDNTHWKKLSEETREFFANYIVDGFLKEELLRHQIDLRKLDVKYITLEEFVTTYRELKKRAEAGEIQAEMVDRYVFQYVQDDVDDVILLTEDNINEILGFCKDEIRQNELEFGTEICCAGYTSEFIKGLLESLIKRESQNGINPERTERISKYLDYFSISPKIGLRRNKRELGLYSYGYSLNSSSTFWWEDGDERKFEFKRDLFGNNEKRITFYEVNQLREMDENRKISNDGASVTVDEYWKKRIANAVCYRLRQEIIARQIDIREKKKDTAFLFEEEFFPMIRLQRLYRHASDEEIDIAPDIESDIEKIIDVESEMSDENKNYILLTDENVEELVALVYEALLNYDYSDDNKNRMASGRACIFVTAMLRELKNELSKEPISKEDAEKIIRIEAFDEYMERSQYARKYNDGDELYEYNVGNGGKIGFKVEIKGDRDEVVYLMSYGCEFIKNDVNIVDLQVRESGYLAELDNENDSKFITVDEFVRKRMAKSTTHFLRQEIIAKQIKLRKEQKNGDVCYLDDDFVSVKKLQGLYRNAMSEKKQIDSTVVNDVRFVRDFEKEVIIHDGAILLTDENVDELMGLIDEAMQRLDYSNIPNNGMICCSVYDFVDYMLKSLEGDLMKESESPERNEKISRIKLYIEYVKRTHYPRKDDSYDDKYYYVISNDVNNGIEIYKDFNRRKCVYRMKNGQEWESDSLNILDSSQIETGYLTGLDNGNDEETKDKKASEREEGNVSRIFSKDSLRQIYVDTQMNRRQEFRERVKRAIEYFEKER